MRAQRASTGPTNPFGQEASGPFFTGIENPEQEASQPPVFTTPRLVAAGIVRPAVLAIGYAIAIAVAIRTVGYPVTVTISLMYTRVPVRNLIRNATGHKGTHGNQCYGKLLHKISWITGLHAEGKEPVCLLYRKWSSRYVRHRA